MHPLRILAVDIRADVLKALGKDDYGTRIELDRKFAELEELVSHFALNEISKELEPLYELYKTDAIREGGMAMNGVVNAITDRFVDFGTPTLHQLADLLHFAERAAYIDAFQFPFGKVLTAIKTFIKEHKEYPPVIKDGLIRLYNTMVQRPMYGRGPFLKRNDELLLFFSQDLDIIAEQCVWYPHLSAYFSEHDSSLLVWKKLWGEAVKASSFKMSQKVTTIIKEASVLASSDQLRKDTSFLLEDYLGLDWHKVTKESETLAVAALWAAQSLQMHEAATTIFALATKAATQEYGGIYSPRLLKVAVSVLVQLGDKTLLPQLLTLQSGLRQKSYRSMIQTELENFAHDQGIPPEFVMEMLLSLQDPSELPTKTLQAAKISLERWYLHEKSLPFTLFQEIFLSSPLWNGLLQGLVFTTRDSEGALSFMISGHDMLNEEGKRVEPSPGTIIQLWHPILASEQEQNGYAAQLKRLGLKQLFKQVDREFFTTKTFPELEPPLPERVLKQKVFRTLARLRGWDAPMISSAFFSGLPALHLEKRNVDIVLTMHPHGPKDGELLLLEKIVVEPAAELPKLVTSEILRDIALFQAKAGM